MTNLDIHKFLMVTAVSAMLLASHARVYAHTASVTPLVLLAMQLIPHAHASLLELSYTYNVDAPTTPKLKPFTLQVLQKGINEKGIWVEVNEFCSSEHSGTHVDAPVHYSQGGWSLEAIPLERLWRVPGIVIDVAQAIEESGEVNYAIGVSDLESWESVHGTIPDGTLVLLRTGWGMKSGDIQQYSGLDEHKSNNFPGLSEEAATWLASHGTRHGHSVGVVGVGVDTISVDVGNSTLYPAHRAMYSHNLYGIENLANLHMLPASGFLVTVLPMRIGGGSGGPARVVAELPEEVTFNTDSSLHRAVSSFVSTEVVLSVFMTLVFTVVGLLHA